MVLDIVRTEGRYEPIGFFDANENLAGHCIDDLPVLGTIDALLDMVRREPLAVIVAIGDNTIRHEYATILSDAGAELANAIHPSANVVGTVTLGSNVVVAAGASICAHCRVGDSVIFNTGCIVDHESTVGTAVHVCPGVRIAGRVNLHHHSFIGIGSTIIQCLTIGRHAVVAAGAVVINNVPEGMTVAGVPAMPIRSQPAAAEVPVEPLELFETDTTEHQKLVETIESEQLEPITAEQVDALPV